MVSNLLIAEILSVASLVAYVLFSADTAAPAVKKGMTASRGKAVNKLCYNILAGSCVIKKDACTQTYTYLSIYCS